MSQNNHFQKIPAQKVRKSFRAESRKDYGNDFPENQGLNGDDLNLGCRMRMADALEKMPRLLEQIMLSIDLQNRSLREMADMPRKTRLKIQRLKRIIKAQKAEIAQLKEGTP